MHPTRCNELEGPDSDQYIASLTELAMNSKDNKIVAIGECGLDYDRLQFCPKEVQLRQYPRHFAIAEAAKLPMFLHCRAAEEDFLRITREHRQQFRAGVVHSFTGSLQDALAAIQLDLYIGKLLLCCCISMLQECGHIMHAYVAMCFATI